MPEPNDHTPWVIPPPAHDSFELALLVGEGYELTPAATVALETLARELEQRDVSGFMMARDDTCFDGVCQPKFSMPCSRYTYCRICAPKVYSP